MGRTAAMRVCVLERFHVCQYNSCILLHLNACLWKTGLALHTLRIRGRDESNPCLFLVGYHELGNLPRWHRIVVIQLRIELHFTSYVSSYSKGELPMSLNQSVSGAIRGKIALLQVLLDVAGFHQTVA